MSKKRRSKRSRIGFRDIYVGLWKCRDFEISHLWQRSIFLATFFVLVFTGYGKLLECYFVKFNPCGAPNALGPLKFHGIALILACIGMVLSTLCLCMAKGSKAWYERYENAITDFVDRFESDTRVFDTGVSDFAGFKYGDLISSPEERIRRDNQRIRNRSLLRTGGADYSPSRINVFIGLISFFLWVGIGVLHVVFLFRSCPERSIARKATCVVLAALFAGAIGLCLFLSINQKRSPISSKWE